MKRAYLEITDACNLNCPFCTYEKGDHYLSLTQIRDYLKQIKAFTDYVYLHILGEPLLHPRFREILCFLDECQMHLQLVTNGTLLYKYPDLGKHPCLRKLSISLHSINKINVDDAYFKTIDQLIQQDKSWVLELRFYQDNDLDDKLQQYLASLKSRFHYEKSDRNGSYRLKENVYVTYSEFFRWPDISDPFISDQGTCHGGLDMIAINSRSEVTLCCLDPRAHNKIGDLRKQSLKEILASEYYQQIIKQLNSHHLSCELCQRCTYRERFR